MQTSLKCGLSAVAGAVITLVMTWGGDGKWESSGVAWAEQGKSPAAKASAPAQPQAVENVKLDDNDVPGQYANFARVTATPEEVILDFALNPQPFATGEQHVKVSQRMVLSFYTAKRVLGALQLTIQKHENVFGPIELDVRKRAKTGAKDE